MKIATVSFPINIEYEIEGIDRRAAWHELTRTYRDVDIWVGSGYSISRRKDLKKIRQQLAQDQVMIVESQKSRRPLVCVGPDIVRELLKQRFATAAEATEKKITRFRKKFDRRKVCTCFGDIAYLNCGEIHILEGRGNNVRPRWYIPIDYIRACKIIVNPTHTRMHNDGQLDAKRRKLSEGGRIYVSASNYLINGPRQNDPTAEYLHSVYVNGHRGTAEVSENRNGVVVRIWNIPV